MKFRVGQTVYFYQSTGDYQGNIIEGTISSITKDLSTKTVTYTVVTDRQSMFVWFNRRTFKLSADQLYSTLAKAEKDWKDDIMYGQLSGRLQNLDALLTKIFNEVKEPVEKPNFEALSIKGGESQIGTLKIKAKEVLIDDLNVTEEIEKLKKEVEGLKKKINPKKTKRKATEANEVTKETDD